MPRISYGMEPRYSADDALKRIRIADELGYHACYLADDPSAVDPWAWLAAAARETEQIRLGVSATHVYLREPTLIAQSLATLDELSDGRAEAVVSWGDPSMLDAYGVSWRGARPLDRLREALVVMRTVLDDGVVSHAGEHFEYDEVEIGPRPVQPRLPLMLGALGGPRSLRMAGEVADGLHFVGASAESARYAQEHVAEGAAAAGRDPAKLDVAAICITAVAPDEDVAHEAARSVVASWIGSFPPALLERHGLDANEMQPLVDAARAGDAARARALTTPEITESLSISGSSDSCASLIAERLINAGIDHVALAIVDAPIVEAIEAPPIPGLPDALAQLRLLADRLLPA